MDELFFWLLLILVPILIIGIPILLSIWIYRIMKRKGVDSKWRILAIIPVLIIGYFIYDAFYPSEEFYETDFKEVTGMDLPESADFEFKTAGYPDHFGDYTSVSIINVGTDFYKTMEKELQNNGLSENSKRIGCAEMDAAQAELNGLEIEREFSKEDGDKFLYIAMLSDEETILVQRSSH